MMGFVRLPITVVSACAAVAFLTACQTTERTDDQLASAVQCTTPLPSDVFSKLPDANTPVAAARFAGTWGHGRWDDKLCHVLVVEDIAASGRVTTVYAYGTYPGWNVQEGYNRVSGSIKDGTLTLDPLSSGAAVTYRFKDDALVGTNVNEGIRSTVILSKIGDPLDPALPPTITTGATVTFKGPYGYTTWKLDKRDASTFHWRGADDSTWVKRTNFGPTLKWSNRRNSGTNTFDGSHAELYPLEPGKTSTLAVTSSTGKARSQTCTVLPVETITVPLGTFPTFPVDCSTVSTDSGTTTKHRVYYYSPQHRFFLRRKTEDSVFDVVSIKL